MQALTPKLNPGNPIEFLSRSYVVALSLIAIFTMAGYLSLKSVITQEEGSSSLINIAGRQRRLSQTIALQSLRLVNSKNTSEQLLSRQELRRAVELMQRSHQALAHESGDFNLPTSISPALKNIYFKSPDNLDAEVKTFLDHAKHLLNTPEAALSQENTDVYYIVNEALNNLLEELSHAVNQYESDSHDRVRHIEMLELACVVATLLLLVAEACLIFFPMSRKLASQMKSLHDSQRELNAIFNTVGEALLTLNERKEVSAANFQVEKIWGLSRNEVIGTVFDGLVKSGAESVFSDSAGELGRYIETEAICKDGSRVPLELVVTKTDLSDRILFTASARDITLRKAQQKRISEFYSIVAHELRSPLTSIKGSLRLMQGGLAGEFSEQAKALVDISTEETERLIRLINDFLDLEKIGAGKMDLRILPEHIAEIAHKTITNMLPIAEEAGVQLKLDGRLDVRVDCDRDRILQVMTNLVSNAIKFSPPESTVLLSLGEARQHGFVRCSVKDHGAGIPLDEMPQLFNAFRQLQSSGHCNKSGTGLGLAISKAIIEQHGGTIGVNSEASKGTTFWFELATNGTENESDLRA